MSTPFLGEIKLFSYAFPPKGWALCNGQILSIQQNTALFSLLGTTYGGNGQTTFALPDVRSRHLVHQGPGYSLGQVGGQETVTVTLSQLPAHNHLALARNESDSSAPSSDAVWGQSTTAIYGTQLPAPPKKDAVTGQMAPDSLANVGGGQPHENQSPALVLSYCIALVGVYPSRN